MSYEQQQQPRHKDEKDLWVARCVVTKGGGSYSIGAGRPTH